MDPADIVPGLDQLDAVQLNAYFRAAMMAGDPGEMQRANDEVTVRLVNASASLSATTQQLAQQQASLSTLTTAVHTLANQPPPPPSAPRRNHKVALPSKFSGKRPAELPEWEFALENYFRAMGVLDPVEQQQVASTLLSDFALTWWRVSCADDPSRPRIWHFKPDFMDALRAQFVDKDRSKRALMAFEQWTMARGEAIPAYISRFEAMMLELRAVGKRLDDEMLRVKFITPLPRDCRRHMGINEPIDIDDAFQQARG